MLNIYASVESVGTTRCSDKGSKTRQPSELAACKALASEVALSIRTDASDGAFCRAITPTPLSRNHAARRAVTTADEGTSHKERVTVGTADVILVLLGLHVNVDRVE